jgi:steroid delta-isomerase
MPLLAAAVVLAFLFGQATAQPATSAETAIRDALASWTRQFNAGDADAVCGLFAPDLRYDYRGFPERGFDEICTGRAAARNPERAVSCAAGR